MENKEFGLKRIFSVFKNDKSGKWIFYIGIAGIAAILISTIWPGGDSNAGAIYPQYSELTSKERHTQMLEERVTHIVESITGGPAEVMITLQSSAEYIFANEIRQSEDITQTAGAQTNKRGQTEERFIIIDTPNGGQRALIVTELSPRIKGVVVVSHGGNDPDMQERITNAVTTALDITSRRVSVITIND